MLAREIGAPRSAYNPTQDRIRIFIRVFIGVFIGVFMRVLTRVPYEIMRAPAQGT